MSYVISISNDISLWLILCGDSNRKIYYISHIKIKNAEIENLIDVLNASIIESIS